MKTSVLTPYQQKVRDVVSGVLGRRPPYVDKSGTRRRMKWPTYNDPVQEPEVRAVMILKVQRALQALNLHLGARVYWVKQNSPYTGLAVSVARYPELDVQRTLAKRFLAKS